MSSLKMPAEVAEIYEPLSNELINVLAFWKTYKQLFAASTEQIDLLDKNGGFFFRQVHQCFRDGIILGLARLLDREQNNRYSNLSLNTLIIGLESHEPGLPAKLELDKKRSSIEKHCDPLVKHRMKRLAHNDLTQSLKASAGQDDLPGILHSDIDTAISMIGGFLNTVLSHFHDSMVFYGDVILSPNDAGYLVAMLEKLDGYRSMCGEIVPTGGGTWIKV